MLQVLQCSQHCQDLSEKYRELSVSYYRNHLHTLYKQSNRGLYSCDIIEERALEIGEYIIEEGATVRQAARKFGISKSTVHKDVTERLEQINLRLAHEARKVLDVNKSERHIRGGLATKEKYAHMEH